MLFSKVVRAGGILLTLVQMTLAHASADSHTHSRGSLTQNPLSESKLFFDTNEAVRSKRTSSNDAESTDETASGAGSSGPLPSRSELDYADAHCEAQSYASVIKVGADEVLWDVVQEYSGTYGNDHHWMSLDWGGDVWEWDGEASSATGVLYLLPEGTHYTTDGIVLYYYGSDANTHKYVAPRIGLCGLSEESHPTLVHTGRGISNNAHEYGYSPAPGGGVYVGALYIAQAQMHLYRVDINGDAVDRRTSAVELHYGGKFIGTDVNMTRTTSEELENRAGLIMSLNSTVRIKGGALKQETSNGSLVYSNGSRIDINNADVTARERTYPVVSWKSRLIISGNRFHGVYMAGRKSPVAFYSYSSEDAEEVGRLCFYDLVERCQADDAPYEIETTESRISCTSYLDYCLNNHVTMANNTFSGSWENILWVLSDIYSEKSVGNHLKHAGLASCAATGSSSLKGNIDFDDIGGCLGTAAPTSDSSTTPDPAKPVEYTSLNKTGQGNNSITAQLEGSEQLPLHAGSRSDTLTATLFGVLFGAFTAILHNDFASSNHLLR